MRPLQMPVTIPAAGVSFHQETLEGLQVGQRLQVVHEPDNLADPNACRILTASGRPVGYVPGLLAPRLLASGPSPYEGEVVELLGSVGRRGLRLRLAGSAVLLPDPAGEDGLAAQAAVGGEVSAAAGGSALPVSGVPVFSFSGRSLGTLEYQAAGVAGVRTLSGVLIEYPSAAVRLSEG